jgi:hypothetical protein
VAGERIDRVTKRDVQQDLLAALGNARRAAENHMVACELYGLPWYEEEVTPLLWRHTAPFVTTARFTKLEEGAVGADWLWWWIDSTGCCFGTLAQAKRLYRDGRRWKIDFGYRQGDQLDRLLRTADLFDLPAVYMLLFGGVDYREGLTCGPLHVAPCPRCSRASVSVLAGLLVDQILKNREVVEDAYRLSVPLEDLADPAASPELIKDINLSKVGPDLQAFLMQRQHGARHVARMIFKAVSEVRVGPYSLAIADRIETGAGALFPSTPVDRGHLRASYFPHILRGLRTEVPAYVNDVLAGGQPPAWVTDHVDGMVVVHC